MVEHAELKNKPFTVKTNQQMLRAYILPKLGFSRSPYCSAITSLRETSYVPNRVAAPLSKLFSLVEKWKLRPDYLNPCRHLEKYQERQRERYLASSELTLLTETLAQVEREGLEPAHTVGAIRL